MSLVFLPRQQIVDNNGRPRVGAKAYFYEAGTDTPIEVYTTAAFSVAHAHPVLSVGGGIFPAFYINEAVNPTYKLVIKDSSDLTIYTEDNLVTAPAIYPANASEDAVDVDLHTEFAYGNMLRYGIVPNDATAATANTTAMLALFDATVDDGPRGSFYFPNTTGEDTYHFNGFFEIRDGVKIDVNWCTLSCAKTMGAGDSFKSLFTVIRDFTLENFRIVMNLTGTGAVNGGAAFRLGSRVAYPFGIYSGGIFDQDDLTDNDLPPMGNIHILNGTITSNNAPGNNVSMSFGVGGLVNCSIKNVRYIGSGATGPGTGFYYEPGYATTNGYPDTAAGHPHWESSHAYNLVFENITSENMNPATDNFTINLIEPYNCTIRNVKDVGGYGAVQVRVGEFHFYRPWVGVDTAGKGACVTLKNIVGQDCAGNAISLNAAQGTTGGYLSDANMALAGLSALTPSQKVDLIRFSLDGFAITGAATGMTISGASTISNGVIRGASNAINVSGDCPRIEVCNVELLDCTSVPFRADTAPALFSGRGKFISIRNSKICGGVGAAISLDYVASADISGNQIGYHTDFDAVNESSQTSGIALQTDANGVECSRNFITTSTGNNAYNMVGTVDKGCNVRQPRGTASYTGPWKREGIALATAANIAAIGSAINTDDKYTYKEVIDTTNNRRMFALGANANSAWQVIDASASVTPA